MKLFTLFRGIAQPFQRFQAIRFSCYAILLVLFSASSIVFAAKPVFDGSTLSLPAVQVGENILSIQLELTNPNDLIFQVDFSGIETIAAQTQAACMDPYFFSSSSQLVIPVLEVGSERYQVFLDLIDANLGLFKVNLSSPLLIDSADNGAPPFTVWQSGNSISVEWGSPSDEVDGYLLWFSPYQSGEQFSTLDVGTTTAAAAELPLGADFCLSISSDGPNGASELADFERFTNLEVPFNTFTTDDPVLPILFFPTQNDEMGMALMYDAKEEDKPYGAVFENSGDDENVIVSFNSEHGLLSRITHGDIAFHFANYTATTVDVTETKVDGETTVFPDIPLSNHAVSIIEDLIDAFETPDPDPLVLPGSLDQETLQTGDWAKKSLELGRDILLTMDLEVESAEVAILEQVQHYLDGFRNDIFKSEAGDSSEQALADAQQLLDDIINNFDCAADGGFSCAAYASNQADFNAFRAETGDSITSQVEQLLNAIQDAVAMQGILNQDCEAIVDETERQECLNLQGNPEPGEQEELLPINESQDNQVAQEQNQLDDIFAQANQTINTADLEALMLVNELSFDYQQMIGQRIWVSGYYGDESNNAHGYAYLLNDPTLLDIDEELPHHSHAMLDGALPPQDFNRAEVLIYGEIKDFETASGLPLVQPTPLITVIDVIQVTPPAPIGQSGSQVLIDGPQFMTTPGTQASDCDRVVIIAGGVDARGNHPRYMQAVSAIYTKAKGLGFDDSQIEIFYFDGSEIDVGGTNVVDSSATKQAILDHLAALKAEMDPSCTLSLFVSDHGTGYNATKAVYRGERPVFSGTEFDQGTTYPENTFMFNAKAKTYERTAWFLYRGEQYLMTKDGESKIKLYKFVDGEVVFIGTDDNNSGTITELETGNDFNGDGDDEDNFGLSVAWMEARLGNRVYRDNIWDSDRDGTNDVRLRWDGTRYVAERLVGEEWREMGRDSNGDFMIDATDGGVDWNLDGDKDDHIGFHEGINLLGSEVLWDDELADAIKMLYDTGIHNNIFMVSCYSGGFVLNLQDYVENIFTGSKEDDPHRSRDPGTGQKIHDTKGFLDNWNGIDTDSWLHGEQGARDADAAVGNPNMYIRGGVTKFELPSIFQDVGNGEYLVKLDLPFQVLDSTYDFEFIFGLQIPRWDADDFEILEGLEGLDVEPIPGGIRAFDIVGIEDGLTFRVRAPEGLEMMRIELTDILHNRLGYIMAMPGVIEEPLPKLESNTLFEPTAFGFNLELDIPEEAGDVYDFEFLYEDQDPPWLPPLMPFPDEIPPGIEFETIEGGIRFYSNTPIPDNLKMKIVGPLLSEFSMMRIQLTDINHDPIGWVMGMPGTVLIEQPLLNPCVPGDFVVNYNNLLFPPDPIIFDCNGQALLAGAFGGTWTQDLTGLNAIFAGGLTDFWGLPPLFPPFPPGPPLLLPPAPNPCFVNVQWMHFGLSGSNAFICPGNPMSELMLLNDRFKVEVEWNNPPSGGPAQGFPLTLNSGGFFFFNPESLEVIVKVLNGCQFNDFFWVFAAATTNVEYTMTVTDTQSSEVMQYTNPLGVPSPAITDTQAFATCP